MIGVNPPGHFLWDREDDGRADRPLRRPLLEGRQLQRADRRPRRVDAADRRRHPDRWLLPADQGGQRPRRVLLRPRWSRRSEAAPLSAPMTLSSWLSAADGDASGFWLHVAARRPRLPPGVRLGRVRRRRHEADAAAARDYFSPAATRLDPRRPRHRRSSGAGGRLADAWPASPDEDEYSHVRTSKVETLLIGGALDFATPPQVATKELLPHLPNGHQVVLPGFGHTTSFWTEQPEAGTQLINTFFDTGKVDDSLYEPAERRLHARGHADGARQGHRRHDGRPRAPHGAVAARDGAPGAQAGSLRAEVQRVAPLAVSARARPGRMVPRRPHRRHDDARHRLSTTSCSRLSRSACRSGSGSTSPGCTATGPPGPRPRASRLQWEARSSAPGSGSTQRPPACAPHHDRRSSRRREPGPRPPGHRVGPAASRPRRDSRPHGNPGGPPLHRLGAGTADVDSPAGGPRVRRARRLVLAWGNGLACPQ